MTDPRRAAQADQERAANADTRKIMETLHGFTGGTKGEAGSGEVTFGWQLTFTQNLKDGKVKRCVHAANPVPCILNAWELDKLRCVECNQVATILGQSVGNNDECDGCQGIFPGKITPVIHKLGSIMLIGGMCPSCVKREHATGGAIR